MDYVIRIGKNYIGCDNNGKYMETSDINKATKGAMHRLNNILCNSIQPCKRGKCKIVSISSIREESVVTKLDIPIDSEKSSFDDVFGQFKKIDIVSFNKELEILSQKLSTIDQEICDIQHYIEFNKLNAANGYKTYKLLRDKLLKRRVIKNDFYKFQLLKDAKVSDIFDGTLEKKLEASNTKTYTPRVLKELF